MLMATTSHSETHLLYDETLETVVLRPFIKESSYFFTQID